MRRIAATLIGLTGVGFLAHGLYIPAKAALAQHLLERAWAEVEAGKPDAKPWPWADTSPVGEITLGGKTHIVLRGSAGEAMAFAPALMEGVDQPIISAHRDTHFRSLGDVEVGDIVLWRTLEGETVYRIAALDVVEHPKARVVEGALILTTCWPLDGLTRGPERLVVTALEVGVEKEQESGPIFLHDAVRTRT